jgi:hypothetical protein
MNEEQREHLDAQEDQQMRASAQRVALQSAADQKERTIHNENFLNELRKSDLESDEVSADIEGEFPDWFSGARAVTNRGDDWELEADLRMMNKRERAVAERRPGRLLRDRPFLLASMRGDDSPPLDAYKREGIPGDAEEWKHKIKGKDRTNKPMSSKMMSRVYGSAEVAADLMILSRNAAGLDSVSTVKTETTTRRQEEEDSTASRLGRVLE